MNDSNKILGAAAAGAVLVPLFAATVLDPPTWLMVTLLLVAVAVLLVVVGRFMTSLRDHETQLRSARMDSFPDRQPTPPPPPMPEETPQEDRLAAVPVPSAVADYRFTVSATVRWTQTLNGRPVVGEPSAMVKQMVLDRICAITSTRQPTNPLLVQHELAADLGLRRPDRSGTLVGWAVDIVLALDDDDAERLTRLASLRKSEQVWEHERRFEITKRDYLGNDVLKSTGSAVVWRLAQDHKIVETVDLIDTITRLTAAANDESVPRPLEPGAPAQPPIDAHEAPDRPGFGAPLDLGEQGPPPVPPVVALADDVADRGTDDQRDLFVRQLARLLRAHDRADLADLVDQRPDHAEGHPAEDAAGADASDPDTAGSADAPARPWSDQPAASAGEPG
ncbi:hypothetical protein [Actinokineospora pegani]|uniref:hypothetical protein n=1 Tax=Actinokineospora pegani TaxID=2654637 RepID=UPI0012E9C768|nr:hypothetical protein [Actinokineospora pegani]